MTLPTHGVFFLGGALLSLGLARKRLEPLQYRTALDSIPLAVLLSLIGARLAYLSIHPDLWTHPVEWFQFWRGGMVSYGGLGGAWLGLLHGTHRAKLKALPFFDRLTPCLLAGWGVGRLGCFITWFGEEGTPTQLPWAVTIAGTHYHPTLLYLSGSILILSFYCWRYPGQRVGDTAYLGATGFFLLRAFFDMFRAYHPEHLRILSQSVSALLAILCYRKWQRQASAGIQRIEKSSRSGR